MKKGVTLIELIILMGLIVLVGGVLTVTFERTFKVYRLETNRGKLILSTNDALDRISREVRQSLSVAVSSGTYTTGAQVLVLQLASVDAQQKIIPATYDYLVYRLDPTKTTNLQEIIIADAASSRTSHTRVILANVSALAFTYYDKTGTVLANIFDTSKQVQLSMTTSLTSYAKTITVTYDQTASLRNK